MPSLRVTILYTAIEFSEPKHVHTINASFCQAQWSYWYVQFFNWLKGDTLLSVTDEFGMTNPLHLLVNTCRPTISYSRHAIPNATQLVWHPIQPWQASLHPSLQKYSKKTCLPNIAMRLHIYIVAHLRDYLIRVEASIPDHSRFSARSGEVLGSAIFSSVGRQKSWG